MVDAGGGCVVMIFAAVQSSTVRHSGSHDRNHFVMGFDTHAAHARSLGGKGASVRVLFHSVSCVGWGKYADGDPSAKAVWSELRMCLFVCRLPPSLFLVIGGGERPFRLPLAEEKGDGTRCSPGLDARWLGVF